MPQGGRLTAAGCRRGGCRQTDGTDTHLRTPLGCVQRSTERRGKGSDKGQWVTGTNKVKRFSLKKKKQHRAAISMLKSMKELELMSPGLWVTNPTGDSHPKGRWETRCQAPHLLSPREGEAWEGESVCACARAVAYVCTGVRVCARTRVGGSGAQGSQVRGPAAGREGRWRGRRACGLAGPPSLGYKPLRCPAGDGCNTTALCGHFPHKEHYSLDLSRV